MSEIAQDLSTSAQIAVIEDNFLEYVRFFGRWRRVDLHENVGLLWLSGDIPYPVFNIVARTQLAPDKVDAAIEEVTARCKARNVPTLWITGPNTRPADLGVHLNAHGFAITGNPVGMAADLHSLPEHDPAPPGLVVKLVTEMATLRQWIEVSNRVFERPDFAGQAYMDVFSSLGLGGAFRCSTISVG